MSKLSFLDKLRILFDLSKSSVLYLIILIALISLGIVLISNNRKNEKRNKTIYISISVFILFTLIIMYHSSLGNMFQYMMENFFVVLYFPNLAIYLAALIATNIILWISIFSYKSSKQIKTLNTIVYIIMNYLLALLLNVINKNNLDIFTKKSVYTNENATALIELSSTLFFTWIIFLIIYKIILIYLRKDYKPKVKKILIKKRVKKLPENFLPVTSPSYIYGEAPKKPVVEQEKPVMIKENINNEVNEYEKMLTLDDYKRVLKLLQSQTEKKKQETAIRKDLEIEQKKYDDLIKKQHKNEQAKYEELLNLYR
jgi:hypothetical protein